MTNRADLVKIIADLIKNGINMDSYSIFDCNLFMKDLSDFINVKSPFNAHYSGSKISIESIFFDPMLSVELEKTTIHCIPVNDEGWIDAVFEVVKYLHLKESEKQQKEQERKKKEQEDNKQFDWL